MRRSISWDHIVNYALIGDPPSRCVSAEQYVGYRCARLPTHDGQCVAITHDGALIRFARREPHPDQVAAARAVEAHTGNTEDPKVVIAAAVRAVAS